MYNLQEAYLGVYYDLDEGVLGEAMVAGPRRERMRQIEFRRGTTGRDRAHAFNIAVRGDTKPFDSAVKSKTPQGMGNKNKRRRGLPVRDTRPGKEDYSNSLTETPQNEGYDLYDLIFDYLLDEGYADTEEAATVIMANMSEDWIDDICGEVLDEEVLGARKGTIRSVIGKGGKSIKYVQSGGNIVSGDRAAQERADAADRRRSGRNRVNAAQAEQARKKSIETMNSDPNESPDRHTITRHHKGRKDSVDLGVEYYHDEVPTDYRARRRRASGR